jgi:dolichol kinase/phosphoserine phosphatase
MSQEIKGKVAVFDVEGVLIPKNRFFFELAKTKSNFTLLKVIVIGFLYGLNVLKLELGLKWIFSNLKGTKISNMEQVFQKIPSTPQLRSFMEELKLRNYRIILISSGVPTFLVKRLADCIGADDAYGIDLEVKGEVITGRIMGDAIESQGKLKICSRILEIESLPQNNAVVVADDRNNSCLFLPNVLKIAFNPDFILRVKADYVVMGKLSSILPIIDKQPIRWHFPSKKDLVREDIHASGFFVPVIASLISVPAVAAIIILISLVYLASELFRLEGRKMPLISSITRHAASQTELHGFVVAPLYFALGILLTLLLFPVSVSGPAIGMFAFGDSSASIFGGIWGKRLPFNKGKTLDGALAGFFFAFLAGTFFGLSPLYALAGAAFAMTIEALPLPINDNIVIPVLTGLFLTLII